MTIDNWPLRKKLRSNFFLYLLCFLVAIMTSLVGFNQVNKLFNEVASDSVPDIIAILELKSLSKRLFAEIQGFVATGDEEEVGEFEETNVLFEQWLERWTVNQTDSTELGLKSRMAVHKTKLGEFAQSIYQLEHTKRQLINEFERLQHYIWQETEGHNDETEHQLYNYLPLYYHQLYNTILWHPSDEDSSSHSSSSQYYPNEEFSFKELSDSIASLAPKLDSPSLSTAVSQLVLVSEKLIDVTDSIREALESVEEYEEEILDTIDKAVAIQTNEVAKAFELAGSAVDKFMTIIYLIGIISVILSIYIFRYVLNSITNRLSVLVHSVKEVTNGHLNTRTQLSGLDEFGQLGASFDKMTRTLSETTVSKEYLDNILASMTESLVVTSKLGMIEVVNDMALKMLGYEREELIGKSISLLIDDGAKTLVKAFDSTHAQTRSESHYVTKSGERISVILSSSHLLQDNGKSRGIVFVAADVRQLKHVQQQLEQTNIDLQATQSQLIQASKLASIGELSAGVAHEINQPLMVIRNGGQMLERKLKKGLLDDDKLTKYLESVSDNSKRMMKIINHLRTFSRRSSTDFEPVDVNKVIHDSFYLVSEQLRLHDISVEIQLADPTMWVLGEANQLEQVILNLISNARDSLDSACGENKQLNITSRLSEDGGKYVEVLVTDNGHGIPDDVAKSIFDPFYTTKEEGKGTGLGLSISYGIIKDHQGTIDIAQTSANGTTMRIRLPIMNNK